MLFGLADAALLGLVAKVWPRFGIFASWVIPMVLTILTMSLLIFGRLVPRQERDPAAPTEPVALADMRGFVTYDYLAVLAGTALSALVPIIVAAEAGNEANAYFYVAWVMRGAVDVALVGVATSLTVEGARTPEQLGGLAAALTRRVTIVAIPIVAVVTLGAPLILSIYGPEYAAHSSGLLRLLGLAIFPRIVVVLWVSVMRVRRTLGRVLAVEGAIAAGVVGLSAVLVGGYGIVAVGLVNLACQGIAAAILLPGFLRILRGVRPEQAVASRRTSP